MDDADALKHLIQSLDIGVAVVEPETWAVVFENATFFQWLPPGPDADEPLGRRLPRLNVERALGRLRQQRPFSFEAETRSESRPIPLRVELKPLSHGGRSYVLVECYNISKQKETEYMLESYSKMSEKHTRDLQREKDRVEKLLLNVMPKSVYEEMKDFGSVTPQRFDAASILMLDFVGFTDMAVSQDPRALVAELNDIFSAFDRIVELFGCERIKTIGDAYLAVSGLPDPSADHAQNVARVALRLRRYLERRNAANPEPWRCRIGINSGPVIGSLVGIHKYVYDIFGPGVNLAARLESLAEPMTITLCEDTYELIKDDFVLAERGEFDIKGFGRKRLYFLEGERRTRD